jgi:LmbE family N-acetylglucosaminyl deacetylase
LGAEPGGITFLGLPDTAAPTKGSSFERAVATISDLVQRHACGTIMAPWRHDPHGDHVAAAAMADACVRATGARCFAYPVWGWTLSADILLPETTVSGFRLKISSHLATKQAAIAAHHSQYSGLISDDPGGFQLPPTLLAIFARPYEVFIKL